MHGLVKAVSTMYNCFVLFGQIYIKLPKSEMIAKVTFHFFSMFCLHELALTIKLKCEYKAFPR